VDSRAYDGRLALVETNGTTPNSQAASCISRTRVSFVAPSGRATELAVIVYAVADDTLSPEFPLGDSLEVFIR
jgi:hypothetical protein